MKIVLRAWLGALACLFLGIGVAGAEPSLLEIQRILVGKKLVDLTHAVGPGIPLWHGFPEEKRETAYWYEKGRGSLGEGFFAEIYTRVDPSVKLEALESVVPPELRFGRFKATDKLIASLREATFMRRKKPSK